MQPSINLKVAIEERRAARSFKSDAIAPANLEEIFRLGLRSPSGYNLQPWRFIVLRDRDSKEKLKACAFNQRQIGEAPLVLICCGDRRVVELEYTEFVIKLGQDAGAMPDVLADVMRSQIPGMFEYGASFK